MGIGVIPPEVEEREKHLSAIQSLSEQHRVPTAAVAEIYRRELASISRDALITTYLPIFVARRVGDLLRKLATTFPPLPGPPTGSHAR